MTVEVTGWSIFCDDIRQEVGGKRTYVGVYQSVCVFRQLPASIMQLFISSYLRISVLEKKNRYNFPTNGDMLWKVYQGDTQIASHRFLPKNEVKQRFNDFREFLDSGNPDFKSVSPSMYFNHIFRISPASFDVETSIKVRVFFGEEEFKVGALQIKLEDKQK